jgi:hypothetical protein
MMIDDLPFVPARWFTRTTGRQIDLVVLHDMEYPEKGTAAEDCATIFQTGARVASAHICVDSDTAVRCVQDQDIAYGAPSANHNGLHIEHAGYASQTMGEWLDDYGTAMLTISAGLVAEWCDRYKIPKQYLAAADLRGGARGITTHRQVNIAWPANDGHTDPGPDFPIDWYIALVQTHSEGLAAQTKENDDVATLVQADDGDVAVFLTDGVIKSWVRDGNALAQLRDTGLAKAALDGTPIRLHRATIDSFALIGPAPAYDPTYNGPRSA